jgi:GNAT superfamily N-acetyltransferase
VSGNQEADQQNPADPKERRGLFLQLDKTEVAMVAIFEDKRVSPAELISLMASVGWGDESAYDAELVSRSVSTYPLIAHARADDGSLVGYISAVSDDAFSVFLGELVVHPKFQRQGVGSRLLHAVESRYAVPVYVKSFLDQQRFFEHHGYSPPRRPMAVLSKRNGTRGLTWRPRDRFAASFAPPLVAPQWPRPLGPRR